jgi:plastocyanin
MNKLATGLCAALLLAAASAASAQEGSVSGTVKFDGKAPKPKKINNQLAGDKYCGPQNAGTDVFSEDVIVGATGELANVFVWVKGGIKGSHPAPDKVVEIDQFKCVYKPHIITVMVGQTFRIKNSDDTMHNIHGLPTLNKEFNEGQGQKGMTSDKKFSHQEIGVKIKCDVHPWMGAWLHVVEHPFFAVTGIDGKFSIGNLPAGEYEIEAWHEKYGNGKDTKPLKVSVKVGDKEAKTQDFTFKPQ